MTPTLNGLGMLQMGGAWRNADRGQRTPSMFAPWWWFYDDKRGTEAATERHRADLETRDARLQARGVSNA